MQIQQVYFGILLVKCFLVAADVYNEGEGIGSL